MALSASERAQLEADLVVITAQLEAANATLTDLLLQQNQQLRTDTGVLEQQSVRWKLESITKTITFLRGQRDSIQKQLSATNIGICTLKLRRGLGS